MQVLQQRQLMLTILCETVAFYNADTSRRATTDNDPGYGPFPRCEYETEDGRRCAVSRYVREDVPRHDLAGTVCVLDYEHGLDTLLEPRVAGLSVDFWQDTQQLHDKSDYWCETGLTCDGLDKVQEIIKGIGEGLFDNEVIPQ